MKIIIKRILNYFGISIYNRSTIDKSDDPLYVLTKLLPIENVLTIVDGGASIGDMSLSFSNKFPKATIYSFEPYTKSYKILSQKTSNNDKIVPHQIALSDSSSTRKLSINTNEGTNSLLKSGTNNEHPYFGETCSTHTENVKTKKIDELFHDKNIDIFKLDLQGSEYNALLGAEFLLNNNKIKTILCEIILENQYDNQKPWYELVNFITRNNFILFNLYQTHYHHGQLIQFDALFIHSNIIKDVKNSVKASFHPHSKYTK